MTRISDSPAPYGTPHKPGISLDFVSDLGSVTSLSDADNTKAMRGVAARARDAEDARLLLDVLGLIVSAEPAPAQADCEPVLPVLPILVDVGIHTTSLDGRHIRNVPTRGLL